MLVEQLKLFEEENSGNDFESISKKIGLDLGAGWPDRFGEFINKAYELKNNKKIRTLSLFSGAGGLDIGFHDAGFEIVSSVEIDKRFATTLMENSGEDKYFGESKVHCIDIRDFKTEGLGEIDFVIGGPPCQTFSAAGRRAAGVMGTNDERGMLFQEYVRILNELKPKGFLFENVGGITGANAGDDWEEIKRAFAEAGYNIFYRLLDAADYGVPQFRERMIIVGTKDKGYLFPKPTHGPDSVNQTPYYTAGQALVGCKLTDDDLNQKVNGSHGHLLNDIPPGLNYSFYTEKLGHPQPIFAWRSKFSDYLYKADPEKPIRTLKAQGGQYTGPFHWDNRKFSISELKRLQTFPDKYPVIGTRNVAIHQIGNSVAPQMARILALSILEQIFEVNIPLELNYLQPNEELGFKKRKRSFSKEYAEKAKVAIENISKENIVIPVLENKKYIGELKVNFDWSKNPDGTKFVNIDYSGEELIIGISNNSHDKFSPAFEILIQPQQREFSWKININKIRLIGSELDTSIFIALWKALDLELKENNLKADLVQLCGYYQYEPNIKSQLVLNSAPINYEWSILSYVVEGIGVRKPLHSEELASLWNLQIDQVKEYAILLKELGFEVRNNKTNPQMEESYYLLPYAFPTLTPLSVQLNKSLE